MKIPDESLLMNYLPANYSDTFGKHISNGEAITPDELVKRIFTQPPRWVDMLMKLRNLLVRPFGLKSGKFEEHLSEMIRERSEREIILGMDDKHLGFYVSLWCSPPENDEQDIAVTTFVKYNRISGRIYFFFIFPFHKSILKSLLKRI